VTDQFTWVMAAATGIAAVMMFFKTKGFWKIAVPVVLLLIAVSMRTVDAKFWGVVVMGGAVVLLFSCHG
jgi:hypothetical protein